MRFEAFIELHPELHHVRTRVRTPGQNGSRERGFGTLNYERLFIDEIDDVAMLANHADEYRLDYNSVRPHEAIAWSRPQEVHLAWRDPTFPPIRSCQLLVAGYLLWHRSPHSRRLHDPGDLTIPIETGAFKPRLHPGSRRSWYPAEVPDQSSKLWYRFILKVTGHFRSQRGALLTQTFPDIASYRVCDLGGSRHFWLSAAVSPAPRSVDILNISMEDIDAAGVSEDQSPTPFPFTYEIYDGSNIPRSDKHYDLLICNSVLEHVSPERRSPLASEMARVAERLFVQTPAKGFPIDPHFLMPIVHWVPRRLGRQLARVSLWRILSRSNIAQTDQYFDGTQLLARRELQRHFPRGRIVVERFLRMPKSYVLILDADPQAKVSVAEKDDRPRDAARTNAAATETH